MPGLNRKGPDGNGAMTGRKMGQCNPTNKGKSESEILENRKVLVQDQTFWGFGKGRGQGQGRRRGGRGFGARVEQ